MVAIVDFTAPEGVVTGKTYLVNYDEDLWLALDNERREFCQQTWVEKAKVMPAVKWVVLKLIPDDLFPTNGHETPYIVWQLELKRPPECGFTVSSDIVVIVDNNFAFIQPKMRADISRALEDYKRGTPYSIYNKEGTALERGVI